MPRILFLIALAPLLLLPLTLPGGDDKKPDYQKVADNADWKDERFRVTGAPSELNGYRAEVIPDKDDRFHSKATVRVTAEGGKEVYSWDDHARPVFLESGGVLYRAEFNPSATGCGLLAFDLKAGKKLWRREMLEGLGPKSHFRYSNDVRLEVVDDGAIAVYGQETFGRYIEIVDRKTGKTVGHKLFPKEK